jgi:twitching motility protein PilT
MSSDDQNAEHKIIEKTRVLSGHDTQLSMQYLVKTLIKYHASDLHIKVGRPPLYRINGKLVQAKMANFTPEQVQQILHAVLTGAQIKELEKHRQIDLSFSVTELGRFRCNIYYQRGCLSAAVRMIPFDVPKLDTLGLPDVLKELVQKPRGLMLVTGATGSGKSTTLAALVGYLNETTPAHIVLIEDPMEFVHRDIKASITQREVGSDTHSLKDALRSGLRQDPDIIVIGELRDYEMIQGALTAAETGHLVLATLHTNDARSTIDRIIDVFPVDVKNQIRIQLAWTLVGIVSQQLILSADGNSRVVASEVMVKSPTIENCILKNELDKIPSVIASSRNYYKMQTMNQSLEKLVNSGQVSFDEAIKASSNPDDLRLLFSGMVREEGYNNV